MGKKFDLDAVPTNEMWQLHVEIGRLLSVRLTSRKGNGSAVKGSSANRGGGRPVKGKLLASGLATPKIPKSERTVRDLVRPREAAALADSCVENGFTL